MDGRDFQIVVELYRSPFASYEAIGRAIGTSGTAVKTRVDRLTRRGVLRGFHVLPSASVFGRVRHIFAYRDVRPEPPLRSLLAFDNVVSVFRGSPGLFMVNTFDLTAGAGPPPGLVRLVGREPDGSVLTEDPEDRGSTPTTLSPLDWRVVDALLDRPRATLAELAAATGLSARTVRNRRGRLVLQGLLHVSPNLDTSREGGLIVYSGYVSVERKQDLERVTAPGLVWVWAHHEPPAAAIFGLATTFAQVQEVETALRTTAGVNRVELTVSRGGADATARLHRWVGAELARWGRSRRAPSRAG